MDKNKKIAIAIIVAILIIALIVFLVVKNTKEVFTVSYMINGEIVNTQQVEEEQNATKPEDPEREGYEFLGWYLGDEKFDFSEPIKANMTLEAKWREVGETSKGPYTITFDIDGNKTTLLTDEEGMIKEPEIPTKEGYNFIGWYIGDERVDFSKPFLADSDVVAKWEEIQDEEEPEDNNQNTNKPIANNPNKPQDSEEPTTPDEPITPDEPTNPEPTPEPEPEPTPEPDPEEPVEPENPEVTYTVSINVDGKVVSTQEVTEGNKLTLPETPLKPGYTFKGWYSNGSQVTSNTTVTGDMTITGEWDSYTYSVSLINDDKNSVNRQVSVYKNGQPVNATAIYGNYNGKTEYKLGAWSAALSAVKIASYDQFTNANNYKVQLSDGTKVFVSQS